MSQAYYASNMLGRSVNPSARVQLNQFANPRTKNLPTNYSTANWIIERERQDFENPVIGDSFLKGDALPAQARFKFNLGRERPYSVVVNNRTSCIQNPPIDNMFCTQCAPHPYDVREYAPYVAPQPGGEAYIPTPMPVYPQPQFGGPPYGGDELVPMALRAGQ